MFPALYALGCLIAFAILVGRGAVGRPPGSLRAGLRAALRIVLLTTLGGALGVFVGRLMSDALAFGLLALGTVPGAILADRTVARLAPTESLWRLLCLALIMAYVLPRWLLLA